MTYEEWATIESRRRTAISRKRSLEMTIRMNETWNIGKRKDSKKYLDRQAKIDHAKALLNEIQIPAKPKPPIGYEANVDGDYIGFYCSDDADRVRKECEIMQELGEIAQGTIVLVAKPRHADRDDFRYTE